TRANSTTFKPSSGYIWLPLEFYNVQFGAGLSEVFGMVSAPAHPFFSILEANAWKGKDNVPSNTLCH
ncbi:MAG: hypothetical protein RMX67_03905, partial [Planktomarina sp.]|nr:hypothetical protein [Planktomarina sp.]